MGGNFTQNTGGAAPVTLGDADVAYSNVLNALGAKRVVLQASATSGHLTTLQLLGSAQQVAPVDMATTDEGNLAADGITNTTLGATQVRTVWDFTRTLPAAGIAGVIPATQIPVLCGDDFVCVSAVASGAVVGLKLTLRAIY